MPSPTITGNWYKELVARADAFMLRLPELATEQEQAEALCALLLEVAKDNYKQGNRAGIAWARSNPIPSPRCLFDHDHSLGGCQWQT